MTHIMKGKRKIKALLLFITASLFLMSCASYYPEHARTTLKVVQPFIDLYQESNAQSTIFHVVERDEIIEVIGAEYQFIKIKTGDGLQGWVTEQEILQTTNIQGLPVRKITYGILVF